MLSVIIGRFQTPYLHQGHLWLIKEAKKYSDKILILVGNTAAIGTDKDPLDFQTRKLMLCEATDIHQDMILPLSDMPSDKDWSDQIDRIIRKLGYNKAIIFGGRDNSIEDHYKGKHQVQIIDDFGLYSSTALRKGTGMSNPKSSQDFRSGIIYHTQNRYPIVYSTVDMILYDENNRVLVGKKGDKFALIGGFIDPQDNSLQHAASRELKEETGIEIAPIMLKYFGSTKVDDKRYIGTKDSIMTNVFTSFYNKLPDLNNIKDKEFSEFRFITKEDLPLVQECHRPIIQGFFYQF